MCVEELKTLTLGSNGSCIVYYQLGILLSLSMPRNPLVQTEIMRHNTSKIAYSVYTAAIVSIHIYSRIYWNHYSGLGRLLRLYEASQASYSYFSIILSHLPRVFTFVLTRICRLYLDCYQWIFTSVSRGSMQIHSGITWWTVRKIEPL